MQLSESYTDLWVTQKRQLAPDLRAALAVAVDQLHDEPEVGTLLPGSPEHVREYESGTVKVTYTYAKEGDTDTFKFISLHKSEARLFKVVRDVFISYSHQDTDWLERIQKFLAKIEHAGDTTFWSDKKIKPGERWLDVIRAKLESATGAILLMSQSFLERPFIRDEELPVLLDKADEAHGLEKGRDTRESAKSKLVADVTALRFRLSWIPIKKVEPQGLAEETQKEIWERISQYQALSNPAEPLERTDDAGGRKSPKRSQLKKLEQSLLDFLQHAFETG